MYNTYRTVFFGEYKNRGSGSNPFRRTKFTKMPSGAEVKPYILLACIEGSKWLLPPTKI